MSFLWPIHSEHLLPPFFSGRVLVFSYFAELFVSKISVHILWVALSSPLPLVLLGMCMKVDTIVSLWFSKILFLSHMYGFSADQILNTLRLYIPYFSKIFFQYVNLFFTRGIHPGIFSPHISNAIFVMQESPLICSFISHDFNCVQPATVWK